MAQKAKGADVRPERPQKLWVSPQEAQAMLDCSNSYFYEEVLEELESCLVGRCRKISIPSIHAYVARKLAEARGSSRRRPAIGPRKLDEEARQ
jgi:hypothetical protein